MDYSLSDFPINHCLPAFTQVHVYWVSDAIWSSHPLPPSFPVAFNLSQSQDLFQWFGSMQHVAKYCSFSISISPFNAYSRLISFRTDWFDFLAVQGTLKSLLQHQPASLMVQLSNHSFVYTDFVGTVMSLLFNMLSRFAIAFLSRSKWLLISWL